MRRRILSILMIFCMCTTMLPQGLITVSAAEEQWVEYDGQTEQGIYTISDESQLRMLAGKVNSGTDYMDTTFKLTEDIELTEEWIPIGGDTEFGGIFDGDNHTIEGLAITSVDYSDYSDCSLFGEVSDATIQNLTVKVDFNSTNGCNGGIVARAYDTKIINCSYEGTIISNNSTAGSYFPGCTGGIAGEVYWSSKIINCRNKGDIKASDDSDVIAGGIVGYASNGVEIINCKNEGSVNVYAGSDSHVGGIAGRTHMNVAITDCQNTGSISVPDSYAGGIVGCAIVIQASSGGYDYSHYITTIANCLNVNEAQDSLPHGEILGKASRADDTDLITIKNCYYKSGSGKPVGSGTADVSVKNVESKTTEQFVSGEVAYLLQNPEQVDLSYEPQDGLVWGQNLGDGDFPGLVYFMEGDKAAKEVFKITLHDAHTTGYTPYKTYINNGATIKAAVGFEQISSQGQYPAEIYETVGLSGDGTGDIFREDAPITEDNTALYVFYKEKLSNEGDKIITSHGTAAEKDLDGKMKYAGGSGTAGNFTYEITDGNGDLKAGLNGSILTIPATADVGSYTLTIKATEKNPTVKNLQKQEGVTIDSEDSVPFPVTVTILADTGKGAVDKDTQSGEGAPKAELPMGAEEMADAVFTETEWQEIEAGKDITLLLTVDNIEEDKVSAEDAEKIAKGAAYYTVGQYLDINLLKTVSANGVEEGQPTRITSTGKPLRVVIYIPDGLKGDGSKARSYAVVRLHDGVADLLEDLDNDEDTVTIETDRFSTYAMVYTELTDEDRVAGAEEMLEEILKGLTATNDTTKEDMEKQIHDKLAEAGYGDVTVTVEFTEKEKATSEKEGSLKGTAVISKGTASGQTMLWEAKIEKVTETAPSASPGVGPTAKPDEDTNSDKGQKVGLIPELKVTQKGKKIQVKWGKAPDADGYLVYVQYCGKKFAKKATKTVRNASTTKVQITKVGGKKLRLKGNFKVYVAAYKMIGGKRVVIKKTIAGHIVGKKNNKYTNAKKVKATKSKITLKAGKTAKIKAKTVRVDKKKKLLPNAHGKKYRYRTMDDSIVTVSKKGKLTAVGKGTCNVYVFAQNGCAKKIKVTVK